MAMGPGELPVRRAALRRPGVPYRHGAAAAGDSAMPSYIIPIQQRYSADLLGVPTLLLLRQDSSVWLANISTTAAPVVCDPRHPPEFWYMST
jgi:hypothetical protein